MAFDTKTLIEKLNPVCRKALEEAAHLCVAQTNFHVEIEHLLSKLIGVQKSDIAELLWQFDVDVAQLERELTETMETFKKGAGRTPAFSPHLSKLLEEGWMVSSLFLKEPFSRSGGLLVALLENDELRTSILESAPALAGVPSEKLRSTLSELAGVTIEKVDAAAREAAARQSLGMVGKDKSGLSDRRRAMMQGAPAQQGGQKALDQYTIDITAQAEDGKIDTILGRDEEIRQMVDILMRRRQNNPIIVGEAGVGKTALVEGLALRIVSGQVPPPLKEVRIHSLDLGLLQAGAGVRGEFENRLKQVISEVKASPRPIIMFIDETHTLVGAGGQAGQGDAANLLKPALARGELRTIGATTWAEYKKHIEKDPALVRRFQQVHVKEPDEIPAIAMLRGIAPNLEKHHKVRIRDAALVEAVRLSNRYIEGRQLPDKAISVLDTSCARVALAQNSMPPALEGVIQQAVISKDELKLLERDAKFGSADETRIGELKEELDRLEVERIRLTERFEQEKELVQKILELENKLTEAGAEDAETLRGELATLRLQLETLQDGEPMVPVDVTGDVIAQVIAAWTGIPVGKMKADEIDNIRNLQARMADRVIGQTQGLEAISRSIRTSSAKLAEPDKPIGVFLLVGPSGVGKTETALALADLLYGGENKMVTINMSEYQEAHTVAGLKGAPPGYVGYGTGGVLTEAVRRNPYTVVLLDEFEKAHPDVWELFYQVFDKGTLEDSEGTVVNFRNTVIILTSNLATDVIMDAFYAEGENGEELPVPTAEQLNEMIRPHLVKHFKPALVGRMNVIPYFPLSFDEIRQIAQLKLRKIQKRMQANHRAELTYSDAVLDFIVERCTDADSGARTVDRILGQTLMPELSGKVLDKMAAEESFDRLAVGIDEEGFFTYEFA